MNKKVPVTTDDRNESYFKYFEMELAASPQSKLDAIKNGPSDPSTALRIDDKNDLFKPGYLPGEFGYWTFEDGTALLANLTEMPAIAPKTLLEHNVKEFINLAKILSTLYLEESEKPML